MTDHLYQEIETLRADLDHYERTRDRLQAKLDRVREECEKEVARKPLDKWMHGCHFAYSHILSLLEED